jgi:mannose-6-phosphate isomerase-like protein (cupin superfamily)
MTAPSPSSRQFEEEGFLNPFPVLSPAECKTLFATLDHERTLPSLDWQKGYAAVSRPFFEIASDPRIVEPLSALLGGRVMLWGASLLSRPPGVIHPWHSDIESSTCGGRTASVWIGLDNTTPESALLLVSRTHLFGATIQEVEHQKGLGRKETTDDDILRWAQERDNLSRLVRPEITNGEALIFDGRLWHGSNNLYNKTRRALLLQYATPDAVVRVPDFNHLDWPFRHFEVPRPPCIMIRGEGDPTVNRIVPAPLPDGSGGPCELRSRIHPLRVPLSLPEGTAWKPYPQFDGGTADLQRVTCHASTLGPGQCPHPPHRHEEEELLLVLSGEVDLVLPDEKASKGSDRVRLKAGAFVYYPANFAHTLETAGDRPANYLMFKWHNHNSVSTADQALAYGKWTFDDVERGASVHTGFRPREVFTGPTRWLRKLHCHTTTLSAGSGYEPHVDAYDVAIVMVSGEVETLGVRAQANDVIFYRAGEPHGMHNPGSDPARYVVFEFHGRSHPIRPPSKRGGDSLLTKLTDPRRWLRKARKLAGRIRRSL